MLRVLYKIVIKATKTKPFVILAQLLMNEKLCKNLLPKIVSIIKQVIIDSATFSNPLLILPMLSEGLFILNKLYEGIKSLKIALDSENKASENCRELIKLGEVYSQYLFEKCSSIISIGDDCFKENVN